MRRDAVKLGVRSKLFLVSVLLITLSVGAAGFILVRDLRGELEARIEVELERHARSAAAVLGRVGEPNAFDALADELGASSGLRITIIDERGAVLGDSEVAGSQLAALDDHSSRPEVQLARADGRGSARRYSKTLSTEMLYVAVSAEPRWIIRTARPLQEVDESVAQLRQRLMLAAFIGLLIAILMSALASHWMTRVIRELASKARVLASRAAVATGPPRADELGHLAGSLDLLATQIESTVTELAFERAQFASVLESMEEGVIAVDESQSIQLINRTALRLLDLKQAPIGRPLIDAIRAPALVDLVANVSEPSNRTVELDLGRDRRLLARANVPNRGRGAVIVLHDITDVHRLETVRRDFVANVSHELRTPVSIISANAETLLDSGKGGDIAATKLLTAIHRNSVRMGRLVADLLDLSRLEAGRYEIDPEPLFVEALAKATVGAIGLRAEEKGTSIAIEIEPGLRVMADRAALDQVLANLLENAIKYTPSGGKVTLRGLAIEASVRIEVEDDGPGIAAQFRDRIFERFYRLDPGRSRDTGGTGLGLSIVKHLVETMSGSVGVANAPDGGSCFWLELPAADARIQ